MNMLDTLGIMLLAVFCLVMVVIITKARARNRRDMVLQYMDYAAYGELYGEIGEKGTLKENAKRLGIIRVCPYTQTLSVSIPRRGTFNPELLGKVFGSILHMDGAVQEDLYQLVAEGLFYEKYKKAEITLFLSGTNSRHSDVFDKLAETITKLKRERLIAENLAKREQKLQKGLRACGVKTENGGIEK